MSPLCFMAETPRGKSGHCFIVPPGHEQHSGRVANFCRAATRQNIGQNFIAAHHQVEQRSPTGAVRSGLEILTLTGVDITQLDSGQKQHLSGILERRLRDLAQLIKRIDWDRDQKGVLVIRQELAEWVSDDQLADFPVAQICDRPLLTALQEDEGGTQERSKTPGGGKRKYLVPFLLGVVLLIGVTTAVMQGWISDRLPGIGPNSERNTERKYLVQAFTRLAEACTKQNACALPADKFLLAMYQLAHGKAARVPIPSLDEILDDRSREPKIWQAIVDYRQAQTPEITNPYLFISDGEISQELKSLFQALLDQGPYTVEKILNARHRLRQFGGAFAALHTAMKDVDVSGWPTDDPLAKVVSKVKSLDCPDCSDSNPLLPFFSSQDRGIIAVFHELWLREEKPLQHVLQTKDCQQLSEEQRSLASFLDAIKECKLKIQTEILNKKGAVKGPNYIVGQRVNAYTYLDTFFQHLGTPMSPPATSPSSSP